MARRAPSRQELIRRRRRSGFVGRRTEQAAFQEALSQTPEEVAQFLFHIHGPGGVGKSTLARQLESSAREARAVTTYVDESVADVVEVMASVSAQLAAQGAPLKELDKALATYRQRRHEADSTMVRAETEGTATAASSPSPSSMVVSQLGLAGLGLIPGVGTFTGAVSADQMAASADRVKALLSARLRNQEDVRLVLSPLQALTPIFLSELDNVARGCPWVVLFFDTYERIGPLVDTWLRDVLVTERYGETPANLLVVLAGQSRLSARCWGDWLDLVTDLPLDVFTEDEARNLLAAKGVTDESVVEMVLEVSGRLPVLVSMLAEARSAGVGEVGDPSETAVERFLKWETDAARRAAALACSLPLELDEDICRVAVGQGQIREAGEASELFGWLKSLPFVRDHAGRLLYHDVVRNSMLRLQRHQSPERWREQHAHLSDAFRLQRLDIEERARPGHYHWGDERWRAARLHETYHRLCSASRTALPDALRELVRACHHGPTILRRWAEVIVRAGEDSDVADIIDVGGRLRTVLDESEPGIAAMGLVLSRGELDSQTRALAHALRGREHRMAKRYEQALTEYNRSVELGLNTDLAHFGRGLTHRRVGRYEESLADFSKAIEIHPKDAENFAQRALTYLFMDLYEDALADYNRALEISPDDPWALTCRGATHDFLRQGEAALADFDRALEIDPDNAWTLVSRGQTHRSQGQNAEALADFNRALDVTPGYDWALSNRGRFYGDMGQREEALADCNRALEIDSEDITTLGSRAWIYLDLGLYDAALADLNVMVQVAPEKPWPLIQRADVYRLNCQYEEALADLTQALVLDPERASAFVRRGVTKRLQGRCDEALTDLSRAIELDPEEGWPYYEKAVVLHALRHPERDRYVERAADLLAAEAASSAGSRKSQAATLGNLFLVHCLMPDWEKSDRYLTEFLDFPPAVGQHAELLAVMNSLVSVFPSADSHLDPFRRRLGEAIDAVTER